MVCVGAGRGHRFGGDKLAEMLGDRTVLETSLAALTEAFPAAPLVVAVASDQVEHWRTRLAESCSKADVLFGGQRRQDSVRIGVERAAQTGADVVAVHDAARPMVHPDDVRSVVSELGDADAAVLCEMVTETVKRVDRTGMIRDTISREDLRFARTPQVFRIDALLGAWGIHGDDREWTDEAAVLEEAGFRIRSVLAHHPNPKITTRDDLDAVRLALAGSR